MTGDRHHRARDSALSSSGSTSCFLIGANRQHSNTAAIFVVNAFLGWT
jgi:hypothetical protein